MKVISAAKSRFRINWRYMSLAALLLAGLLAVGWASAQGAGAAPLSSGVHVAKDGAGDGGSGGVPADASAIASPTCSPNWVTITTPNAPLRASNLFAVAEVGLNDVWAGGSYGTDAVSSSVVPFFEHWDGTSWALVDAPLPTPGAQGQITDISVNSAHDVWAVGLYIDAGQIHELIYRWNGIQWDIVPGAHPSPTDNELNGVTVVSTNNVWAVGTYTVNGLKKSLAQQWNGSTWTVVSSPNRGTGDNALRDVSAVPGSPGTDIWAAGDYIVTPGGTNQTLTLHFDGTSWSSVASANPGANGNQLAGIDAISAHDVWAVGQYYGAGASHTLAEHWNGSTWSVSPTIDTGPQGNTLAGVFATAGNDVWAVGVTDDSNSVPSALIEHWNGGAWSVSPNQPVGTGSHPFAIGGGSASDLWTVGEFAPAGSQQHFGRAGEALQWDRLEPRLRARPAHKLRPLSVGFRRVRGRHLGCGQGWWVRTRTIRDLIDSRALGRQHLEYSHKRSPRSLWRPSCFGKGALGQRCVGCRRLSKRWEQTDLYRALERQHLELHSQPQPGRQQPH